MMGFRTRMAFVIGGGLIAVLCFFAQGWRSEAKVGVPTWTPSPGSTPRPDDLEQPAVQVIEVYPQETEADRRILDSLAGVITVLGNLAAEVEKLVCLQDPACAQAGAQAPVAVPDSDLGMDTPTTVPEVENGPDTAVSAMILSVWEDGSCWTPPDLQVLQLCGAAAGDGYVVRWLGVHGDGRGPEIPDSDWLATQGGGDRLVWAGPHPGSGELVTINYWSGGHVLAVHAAGRLLFRIDRNHSVLR